MPPPDRRCGSCEAAYAAAAPDRAQLLRAESRIVSIAGLSIGVALGAAGGLSAAGVAGVAAALFGIGHWFRMMSHLAEPHGGAPAGWLERHRRRRFLRERLGLPRSRQRPLLG